MSFVTREGCSLCSAALSGVERWARRAGLSLEILDVDRDSELSEFADRVPVILSESGKVLAEGRFKAGAIALAVLRARLGGRGV